MKKMLLLLRSTLARPSSLFEVCKEGDKVFTKILYRKNFEKWIRNIFVENAFSLGTLKELLYCKPCLKHQKFIISGGIY